MDPYERFRYEEKVSASSTCHAREHFIYDIETPLVQGKLISVIRKLKKEFIISFDVKPLSYGTEWLNVIHFTNGSNIGNVGDRIPGVWFHENGSGSLYIATPLNGDPNHAFETYPLPLNQWTNVEISQFRDGDCYMYCGKLNGETVFLQENAVPRSFKNVKVFSSDPWHLPQQGLIRNFYTINGASHKHSSKSTMLHREQIICDVETSLVQGKLVAVIPKLNKEFLLSFDVKPHFLSSEWSNIIHFTNGSNIGNVGDRIPGVWFHENGSGSLYIATPLNDDPNHAFETYPLPLNQWTTVEISQHHQEDIYLYTVKLNGEIVFNEQNEHAKSFKNVKVFASDPWHNAQNGSIKNLYIINRQRRNSSSQHAAILQREQILHDNEVLCSKGLLAAVIPRLDKEFILSFDVKPLSYVPEWTNIIHLTTGSNCGNLGDRVPGVWFHECGDGSLYIATPVNGDPNHSLVTSPLPLNHWTSIEISQHREEDTYLYTVKLNGEVFFSEPNHQPQSFENVKVYVSDPWHAIHNGFIKNLYILNGQLHNSSFANATALLKEQILENIEKPIVKGELVAVIPKLDKEFLFSFDVKPNSFANEWANVIHFTVGSNIGNVGDRIPGVWFHENGSGQLYIATPLNCDPNHSFETYPLALYQWTNIEVSQQLECGVYVYSVKLNGEKVFSEQNHRAERFENVKVYASDPWHKAQDGFIKNFFFLNGHHVSRNCRTHLH
ncbi:uncharacterized protein LOC100201038 isoform X2 [Hydra vulgaris]|uniref:uncharacterized protein LOC100201038 isoform X2 n=1 Tax=Hydra vulgaris TaxID=6087 RepID=UPI0032E9CB29